MKILLRWPVVLLFGWLIALPSAAADVLTTERVEALLDAIDQASETRDVDALLMHMADNAEIHLKMPASEGGDTRMSKKEYAAMTRMTFAMASDYSYRREDTHIDIAADGQSATVTDTTIERVVIMGQTINARAREEATIELIDGKPMIVRLVGDGNPQPGD
jgi:ketosteroid isomerase-like protein